MKTLKFLLAGAVALMAFAGCENTDELVDTTPVYDDAYYASHASISSSDSNFISNNTGGAIHFKVSGGEVRVLVSCGTEWSLQNSNLTSFNAYIEDSHYLTVSAGQNLVEEELTGTITLITSEMHIAFASITVTQNAYGAPEITVDANEWHVPAVGELRTDIGVESTDEWTVEGGDEWLTIEKSGTGLNLTAKENEDTEGRETKIVLTCTDGYKSDSETITVTQDGLAYITLSEEGLEFDANGGEVVITVESNYEWEYTYKSDWFSVEKNEEDGSLKITCDATEVEEDRKGVVTFTAGDGASNTAKVELSIAQGAYLMPKITVETEEWNAPAIGELTTEIGVEANFEWTFDVNADWVTAGKTEKGITLTAKENSETNKRNAEVVLSCTDGIKTVSDTIAVTQDGLAYISLSEEELLVSSFGSSISVTVESNYDWEFSCNADWLTVEKTDDTSLSISYTKNETGNDRETVVTITAGDGAKNIAEEELKITQSWENTDALILEYTITSSRTTIKLPIRDVTNATIDWNDGSTETTSSNHPSHTYTTPGIYTITINGIVESLYSFNYSNSPIAGSTYLTAVKQWGDTGLTSMCDAFYYCENLQSLPEVINSNSFSKVTTFTDAFYNCTSLVTVPSFGSCPVAKSFEQCFRKCTALTTVPENLFSGCTAVTNFYHTFSECSSLISGPSFEGCSAATTFDGTFWRCYALKTVPENMFSGCTVATDFGGMFDGCVSLVSAPSFKGCTAATTFVQTFDSCTSLVSAPSFEGCSSVTSFERTFHGCTSLTTVPENMFSGCTAATTFVSTFSECSSLVSAPSFEGFSSVTTFGSTFYNCSSLVSAPSFEGCSSATTFGLTFRGCTALTTIPENMFSGCTAVTTFDSTFRYCSSLVSAPSFEECSSVTYFGCCFYDCTALTTVPENMFSGCTAVTGFSSCFYNCSSLKDVPVSLFDDLLLVTSFSQTFYGCSSISGESPYTEVDVNGEKVNVHLYERSDYSIYMRCMNPSGGSCFKGSTFSDMDSIPSSWGGNGN